MIARVASSPPSPRTIHSATLSRRTAVRAEGTLSISHRCLVSDHCCRRGKPVVAEKVCASKALRRLSSSAWSRVSCQAMTGATGWPCWSSSTPDSARLATPSPPMTPGGQSSNASATADLAASSRAFASSSAPEVVTVHGVVARPDATGSPSRVNTTALLVVVPTSRPTNRVPCMSLLGHDILLIWNLMDIVAFGWNNVKRP